MCEFSVSFSTRRLLLLLSAVLLAGTAECASKKWLTGIIGHTPDFEPHRTHLPTSDGCDTDSQLQLWETALGSELHPSPVACVDRLPDGCDAKYGPGNYSIIREGGVSNGGRQIGCLKLINNGINQVCPRDYPFAWYAAPFNGTKPCLKECWADNGGHKACDTAPFTSTFSVAALAPTIGEVNATNLAGCTPAVGGSNTPMLCPSAFPFFAANAAGSLPNPTPGHGSCAYTAPVCKNYNKVPVIDSDNADISGTTLGCLGTHLQLGRNEQCPAKVPHPASLVSQYTFFVAAGTNSDGLVASRITECRKKETTSSCGKSMLRARRHWFRSNPDGCLSGHIVVCPAGSIGGVRYDFPLLGPTKPGKNAAPKLEQCSTTAPSCDSVDGGEYTVSVTNGGINDTPAPTVIMACQKPDTACPSFTHYPRISASGTIYACRSVQTACPPGFIPLCKDGPTTGRTEPFGGCPVPSVMGCVDSGAPLEVACRNASKMGYPTPTGFPIFVVSLSPPAQYNLVVACYSTKVEGCGLIPKDTQAKQDSLYVVAAYNETGLVGEFMLHHVALLALYLENCW